MMKANTLPSWPRASASASASASHALVDPDSPRHDSTATSSNPTSRTDSRSMLATQPVLVRAYSGNVENPAMSTRRFFSFSNSRSPPSTTDVPLPSDKDFSIESILQAIEPDIRGTLDSIAEICGRSKLSLANEYGSHIAPLGEITAPPGLGPVEEAPHEPLEVMEDDNEAGPDMHPFSFHRYLENLRHTASMLENGSPQGQLVSPPSPGMNSDAETVLAIGPEPVASVPYVREYSSKPKHTGSQLLAKNADASRQSAMATAAVVSEVHLDASADEGDVEVLPKAALDGDGLASHNIGLEMVQQLLGWLKWSAHVAGPGSDLALQSAEGRLRAMLRADIEESTAAGAP